MPDIRLHGQEVSVELIKQIINCVDMFGGNEHDYSAKFELIPDPRGKEFGHFLVSEVTYLRGKLPKKITKNSNAKRK